MPRFFILDHLVNDGVKAFLQACPHMHEDVHVPADDYMYLCIECLMDSEKLFTYTKPLRIRTKPLSWCIEESKNDERSIEKLKMLAPVSLKLMTRPMTNSYRPLHQAIVCRDWNLVRSLILSGVDRNSQWWSMYNTPLHEAVGNNLTVDIPISIVGMLITPTNIDMINELGQTPLLMALSRGQAHIVLELLQSGADVDQMVGGYTPLHLMANTGQWNLASLLIQNGADVNIQCKCHGNTALHYALLDTWPCNITDSFLKTIKMLITSTNINMTNKLGCSALHSLVGPNGIGGVEVLEELLASGADVDSMQCGMTPLQVALDIREWAEASILLQHGADVNIQSSDLLSGNTALHLIVRESDDLDVSFIKKFITPVNINMQNDFHCTPLHMALDYRANWPVITELLDNGADVNINTIEICSCWPSEDDHERDDVNYQNLTPLMLITKVADVLMDTPWEVRCRFVTPQSINIKDNCGLTALDNTIECYDWSFTSYLLQQGADINMCCNQGLTPLHRGVYCKMPSKDINKLISPTTINAMDSDGWTPLNKATYSGHWDAVLELLKHKADVNIANNHLQPPFITALACRDSKDLVPDDILFQLFPKNINLPCRDDKVFNCNCVDEDEEDENNETANECIYKNCSLLAAAVWSKRWSMMKQFLLRGADFTEVFNEYTFCYDMILQLKLQVATRNPKSLQQICSYTIRTKMMENDKKSPKDYRSLGLHLMLEEYVRLGQDIAEELIDLYDGKQYEAPA